MITLLLKFLVTGLVACFVLAFRRCALLNSVVVRMSGPEAVDEVGLSGLDVDAVEDDDEEVGDDDDGEHEDETLRDESSEAIPSS
jgi:hypothetical protein